MQSDFSSEGHIDGAEPAVKSWWGGAESKRLLPQVFAILGLLLVYRLGEHILLPELSDKSLDILLRLQGGGGMVRLSVFALGIMPYISASIVMQLVIWAFPKVAVLTETAQGRMRINLYIRLVTVLVATMQAFGVATVIEPYLASLGASLEMESWLFRLSMIASMTAGAMMLVWLSDEITRRGLGDGVLLILFAGYAGEAPAAVAGAIKVYQTGAVLSDEKWACLILLMVAVLLAVVAVESARRRIVVAQQGGGAASEDAAPLLALKINPSGAATPFMAGPMMGLLLGLIVIDATMIGVARSPTIWAWIGGGSLLYLVLYGIVIACVAYAFRVGGVNARRTGADETPGDDIAGAQRRLAAFNAVYLAALCLLPGVFQVHFETPFSYGGASLLVCVLACLGILSAFGRKPEAEVKTGV